MTTARSSERKCSPTQDGEGTTATNKRKISSSPPLADTRSPTEEISTTVIPTAGAPVAETSTPEVLKTNKPKRLRLIPPNNTPNATPPPSAKISSSLPSTPRTPQTPSIPTLTAARTINGTNSINSTKLSARKQRLLTDPLNLSIYSLRQQGLDWDDIAAKTNASNNILGTDSELSGSACYSRFFRNAPLIARQRGEGYERHWYLHMNRPASLVGGPVQPPEEKGEGKMDGLRVDSRAESNGEETDDEGVGDASTEEIVENEVVNAVTKLKAMFWVKVAEMVDESVPGQRLTKEEAKAVYERVQGSDL